MPILARETDLFPGDLLLRKELGQETDRGWWMLYTRSRREKDLMRRLVRLDVPFFGPVIAQPTRSPAGRLRTSFVPLFANYVFIYGDADERYRALTTNCVSRTLEVDDGRRLTQDLRQVHGLIASDRPMTIESGLQPGRRVRVRSGSLRGVEGMIVERRGEARLLVLVNFLQKGASVELDDFDVEPI